MNLVKLIFVFSFFALFFFNEKIFKFSSRQGITQNRFVRGRNTLSTLVSDDESSVHEEVRAKKNN